MPFYASPFRVTHDIIGTPFVLLDVDAYLTAWPDLTGGHLVQEVDRVKTAGRKPFDRQNEFSQIELSWCKDYGTPEAAFKAWAEFPASIPRNRATIQFRSEDGTAHGVLNGMFKNWNQRLEGNIVYFTISITGGVFQ